MKNIILLGSLIFSVSLHAMEQDTKLGWKGKDYKDNNWVQREAAASFCRKLVKIFWLAKQLLI